MTAEDAQVCSDRRSLIYIYIYIYITYLPQRMPRYAATGASYSQRRTTHRCSQFSCFTGTKEQLLTLLVHDTQYSCALYWAVQTLSTSGYGDMPPLTATERAFSMCSVVLGVTAVMYARFTTILVFTINLYY